MRQPYRDVCDRIAEKPQWFDALGYPRYCAFAPSEVSNLYASEVALVEIACQNCDRRFLVAFTWSPFCRTPSLSARIKRRSHWGEPREHTMHYGDPPNVNCCSPGPVMNCVNLRIIEFWEQKGAIDWRRRIDLEVLLPEGECHP